MTTAPVRSGLLDAFRSALAAISDLPICELRPRPSDGSALDGGDFDFAVAAKAVPEILRCFLATCLQHGLDLEYRQDFANKKVLTLIAPDGRLTVELWPRIELLEEGRRFEIDTAPLFAGGSRDTLLAGIYLTHLASKSKDLQAPLQRSRLQHFHTGLLRAAEDPASTPDETAAAQILQTVYAGFLADSPPTPPTFGPPARPPGRLLQVLGWLQNVRPWQVASGGGSRAGGSFRSRSCR